MKIYSSSLGREIDLETFQKVDPATGRTLTIVLHRALEAFVCDNNDINYDFTCVSAEKDHCVVKCNMWFKNDDIGGGRRVQTHGEALPATLTSDIARNYPYVMAEKRAFDRAAIRLLNLPQSTYSESEIDLLDMCADNVVPANNGITTYEEIGGDDDFSVGGGIMSTSEEEDLFPGGDDIVITDDSADENDATVYVENDVEDVVVADNSVDIVDIENIDGNDTEIVPVEMSEEDADLANYVITMKGKYEKSNMSIAEIYASDFKWFDWMAKNFIPKNPVAVRDIEKMKEYLAKKGGK